MKKNSGCFEVERLWENKVFIPEHSQQLKNAKQYRRAFETSVIDATRNSITEEELTKLGWYFRFKHTAGTCSRLQNTFTLCVKLFLPPPGGFIEDICVSHI